MNYGELADKRFVDRKRSQVSFDEIFDLDENGAEHLKLVGVAIIDEQGKMFHLAAPARHGDLMSFIYTNHITDWDEAKAWVSQASQGFITADGRFVDRYTGGVLARQNKQINKLQHPPQLYSEDLW